MKIKQLSELETRVLDLIPRGIDNPISTNDLETLSKIDKRTIYAILDRLRRYKVPVCAIRTGAKKGVYIATTDEEKKRGTEAYIKQAREMQRSVRALNTADVDNWEQGVERFSNTLNGGLI
ncbi:DNA replication protein [Floricoccus penangensis]|uniref:DNA replication protein n=1 Tax=Floricoccus penangensis TaxID=1859475 RepID=UPI00203F3AF4|nr:DNA replication protein [Floricoccus penangensis]URZ87210.1 DNA replication protein [Floricoccus penangensis]